MTLGNVVIIGADGGMGKWLTRHLEGIGYNVKSADLRNETTQGKAVINEADIVIVSVPLKVTGEVIIQVSRHMRQGAILAEIASLKSEVIAPLRISAVKGLKPLCIHPMFGPQVQHLEGKTVAVMPIINEERETDWTRRLFPKADIVVTDQTAHDSVMAAVLSLPYIINMAFTKTIAGHDLKLIEKMAGTTFTLQYTLAQSVVKERTELVEALLKENMFLEEMTESFQNIIKNLSKIQPSGLREMHYALKMTYKDSESFTQAHERRQRAFNAIKDSC
ncbi:MAG: prephenate dehydrogenase/arogenate dehydrogenase family protein [Candidatus Bathyarchaeota archaeon]|nr:prephenate dehydrogenase/arogenate dehydrogenase family protein [Candidatus Bathyarchaeota archaeon]